MIRIIWEKKKRNIKSRSGSNIFKSGMGTENWKDIFYRLRDKSKIDGKTEKRLRETSIADRVVKKHETLKINLRR